MENNRYWIHETSVLGKKTAIGFGTKIWQFCNVMDDVIIGNNCNIGQNVFLESGVRIGNGVKIKNNVALFNGVICEDNVFLGPSCVFTNVINPRSFIEKKEEFRITLVKKGATIGANATIVCGNEIGEYAMVGAGTVVIKPVRAYETVIGNPAKSIGYVCQCGCKLVEYDKERFICEKCGKHYELNDGRMRPYEEKYNGVY